MLKAEKNLNHLGSQLVVFLKLCFGIASSLESKFAVSICNVQVHVLQEQLSVEMCARTEAQARVQRLLQQNTDLLQHISLLVKQIQELELKSSGQLTSSKQQFILDFQHIFCFKSILS